MATNRGKKAAKTPAKKAVKARKTAPAGKKPRAAGTKAARKPARKPAAPRKAKPARKRAPARKAKPARKPAPARKAKPARKPAPAGKARPARKPAPAGKARPARKPAPAGKAKPPRKPAPAGKVEAAPKPAPVVKGKPGARPAPAAKPGPATRQVPSEQASAQPSKKAPERPVVKMHRPKARMGPDGIMILDEDRILLKAFYAGQQMPSPTGGFLQLQVVRSREDGSAIALMDCSASSLRYQMELVKATKGERSQVKTVQDAGGDPDCPRHGAGFRLLREGKELVCPLCRISYGRV